MHSGNSTPIDLDLVSTVYGPVRSWRFGWSLGIDLLCVNSICSFNCTYCQLGYIQVHTVGRELFVPTDKVLSDLHKADWKKADILTFSGSGEPCLALNLGEAIRGAKEMTQKPVLVLTNGSLLPLKQVRSELAAADRVSVKLDAASETTFQRINRPVKGLTLSEIVEATIRFREEFQGQLSLQCMFLWNNLEEVDEIGQLILRIQPDEVQLNIPKRPYPKRWVLQTRGSHGVVDYPARRLRTIGEIEALKITRRIREMTGGTIKITSILREQEPDAAG